VKDHPSNVIRQASSVKYYLSKVLTYLAMLGITLLLLSCGVVDGEDAPPVPRPNVLLSVEGKARLKRDGWTTANSVGFGTLLEHDDLLEVEGTARILCGDLTLKELTNTTDSCPCPAWKSSFKTDRGTYRGIPDSVPYIQHPRNTLVLDDEPLLRWHDTGASSYTIAIAQRGSVVWRQDGVMDNEIVYPADAPTLKPGVDYLLVVQDNDSGIESSEDPAKGIGFRMASSAQQKALTAHCEDVIALPDLDDAARDYALALCYATWEPDGGGRRPWGAAWLLLESAAETHDTPAVYLWTGDVPSAMKLPDEAEAAYQMALKQAEALGDLESQAAAHAGLWRVTGDDGHWDEAVELYEELGDEAAQQALEEEK
jgi:hypothetical protein